MLKTCTITGHRPHKLNNEYDGFGPVSDYLRMKLYAILTGEEVQRGISGMALGVDMLFAEECLKLGIRLTAAVPCDGQHLIWPQASQVRYMNIINRASEVIVVSPGPYEHWKMGARNLWMMEQLRPTTDFLTAVWDGSKGGTHDAIQKFLGLGLQKWYRIDPRDAVR